MAKGCGMAEPARCPAPAAIMMFAAAKKDFVLLPRRWVGERPVGWIARCRRLARDYERLPQIFAGLHRVMFAGLLLARLDLHSLSSS